jgi:branched-chain amino acid transport system permease protein
MSLIERFLQASTLALIGVHVSFDISYVRYALTGALVVVLLLYRPRGPIEERPVKTPIYEVLSWRRKAQKLRIGRWRGSG